jgi:ATP-dependent protease Clp ATPase subunit
MSEALYCSFCGKSKHEVHWLVVSPEATACICDACTDLCSSIVTEQRVAAAVRASANVTALRPQGEAQ